MSKSQDSETSLFLVDDLSVLKITSPPYQGEIVGNKKEPSTGSNRGSKRRRAGKEPELTSAPKERTTKTIGKSTDGSKSQHKSAYEYASYRGANAHSIIRQDIGPNTMWSEVVHAIQISMLKDSLAFGVS
ncbi:hypothetical protein Tco_0053270 [Tanacetum coccineum]